ncbi:hypothetical protein QFC21_005833 [Naganishia friedmannii]|uniref:Uncharacterized protein n=1 Tax=Naganishia friedmannii TaxID=89922 RepID=A0ACC2V7Q6_9TREE|nr:hypothetical protein QFC21_005833 [Naganishia friedmannii]
MQSIARAVLASLRFFEKIKPDQDEWKTLLATTKTYLKDQLVKALSKNPLCCEVIFVRASPQHPKFHDHWPLERMIMTVMNTERYVTMSLSVHNNTYTDLNTDSTANKAKLANLARLDAEIQSLRYANDGMPAWLAQETLHVMRVAGARRGRPATVNTFEGEEAGNDDDAEGELDAEAVAGNK